MPSITGRGQQSRRCDRYVGAEGAESGRFRRVHDVVHRQCRRDGRYRGDRR